MKGGEMEPTKSKDTWDKIASMSALLASVLVPLVIALVGNAYTNALKQSENRVKYTELAISLLKDKPSPETQDVRAWAIDVINQYSGVTMSAKAKSQLLGSGLPRSDLSYSDFRESDLKGSNFAGVRFSDSNFIKSLFSNARFDGSIFDGASFRGTRFGHADLRGADLSQVVIDGQTKLPQ
jgi:hypothetical protein